MEKERVLKILKDVGAVITGSHIVYTSGRHGSAYVNKDAIYPYTSKIAQLCEEIGRQFMNDDVEIVIAPAIGGVIMSQWTARYLNIVSEHEVLAVYAEKETDGNFVIKRGYDKLIKGRRVLVVEDVLTTGESAKKVVEAIRTVGGHVLGVGVLCNRGGVTRESLGNVPKLFSLVDITLDSWDGALCPLCAEGVPINTEVGKGREYLARRVKS